MAEEVAHDSERGPSRDARRTRLEVAVAAPDESSRHDRVTRLTERDDITVVGEVSDAIAVTEVAVTRRPDVALLDADLPDLADACRWIGRTAPPVHVVVLQHGDAAGRVGDASDTDGGMVPEPCSLDQFLGAVRALHDGGSVLDPFAARTALAVFRATPRGETAARPRLTERELEVLTLRARGAHIREVAKHLYISENTVKNHFRRIREKLLGLPAE